MRFLKLLATLIGIALSVQTTAQDAQTRLGPAAAAPIATVKPHASLVTGQVPVNRNSGTPVLTRTDLEAWLDGFMPYAIRSSDIAGAVVVVVKDGRVLAQRGYGYSDVDKRTPVDPDRTLFQPGSISKLFTWTAVMQLVEQGRLDLDKDVNAYLDFRIAARDGKPVTLRQLMTHTAGFEETVKNIIFYDPAKLMPLGAYLKNRTPERIFAPGATPAYSNYGSALAGYIVERVAKQSFDDYIEQHIFAPLGMADSTFRQPLPRRFVGMMSRGYSVASAKPSQFEIIGPAPAGSLSSTGADMARFMIAHLQDGALGSERILRPETARMMHDTTLTLLSPLNRMKLGFYETNINGRNVVGHGGDTTNFHSYLHLFLDDNVGLYVSFNSSGRDGAAGSHRTELFERFADRYFPTAQRDGRVPAKVAAAHARMMVGVYEGSRRSETSFLSLDSFLSQIKVELDARGGITIAALQGVDGQALKWVEIAPFVWREANGHTRLAAKVVDGTVVRFSFDDVSPFIVFDRVSPARSSAWLLPALYASLAALALTALFWPVTALARRRFGTTLALDHRSLIAYRGTKIAATLILAVLIGWTGALFAMANNYENLSDTMNGPLWLLQIAGLVAFVGGFAAMLWNLWTVWRGKRRWPAKLWSVVLVCAAATVLWIAAAFKLLAFTVNY